MLTLPRKLHCSLIVLFLLIFAGVFNILFAKVVPHPLYKNPPDFKAVRPSEQFGPGADNQSRILPQQVLVLRVQFSDTAFQSVAAFPDELPHDRAYFERWMLHLTDFYASASHNQYLLNYTVYNTVFNLSNTMSYYGNDTDDEYDARVPDMILELIQMADIDIDFSQYDAIVVFHAGPGQESDLDGTRPGEIWSTFITRGDLQEAFDPDNDNYPGIQTNDGTIIKELVLVPESEFQDYFPVPPDPNSSVYLFSIYGVLCHQFGHQIGLPTLFDNYSANGRSQGIGNWGLMGTGLWNGNGNVPAQLSAWSRYYLGWENAITIAGDTNNLTVDYFMNNSPTANRLYKIPISEREYFLVENRQQNPDASLDPYTGQPSFTFALLDPSEQDYYPAPDSLRPFFNFMENRYKGCEWDFFLPGLGGPLRPQDYAVIDGSGLLIWHIDENIINENFDPGFDHNWVNYDAFHKGVDVEEADGIQHLDTANFDYYKYGGPFDTFREDTDNPAASNTYFGNNSLNGLLHLPTAESYYGGIPAEIFDISSSGNQMTFSARFVWRLDTSYIGNINLDACSIDYDNDNENEIFYPMPDGTLYMWKDEELAPGFPINSNGDLVNYLWDDESVYLAYEYPLVPLVALRKLHGSQLTTVLTLPDPAKWAAPIMSFDDYVVLPYQKYSNDVFVEAKVDLYNKNDWTVSSISWNFPSDSLIANLAYYRQKIYSINKSVTDGAYSLNIMTPGEISYHTYSLSIPADSAIVAMSVAPIMPSSTGDVIIQTPYSIFITDLTGQIRQGYPILLPFYSNTQVSISDTDKNGTLDFLVSGENSFAVYDFAGKNMLTNFDGFNTTDSLYITSGILSGDLDGDNKTEYIGAFSRNRLAIYEDNLRLKNGYPVSFSDRCRSMPFIHLASDSIAYAWLPTDNGKIFRSPLPETALAGIDNEWYCKNANLQRISAREATELPNDFETTEFFVPGQTYIFPNPLRPIYDQKLTFQIMTSKSAKVEVSVFDIMGKLLYRNSVDCQAYLKNRELVDFQVDHLSSGVYIAVMKSGNNIKRIKFAVEK